VGAATEEEIEMSVKEPKDLMTRLADAGEDAISKLGDVPGADRLLTAAHSLRERMDDLQRRVRGIEALEQRVAELERRVDVLSGGSGAATGARKAGAAKATKTRSTSTPKSPRSGSTPGPTSEPA
jgi:hypothetical protein